MARNSWLVEVVVFVTGAALASALTTLILFLHDPFDDFVEVTFDNRTSQTIPLIEIEQGHTRIREKEIAPGESRIRCFYNDQPHLGDDCIISIPSPGHAPVMLRYPMSNGGKFEIQIGKSDSMLIQTQGTTL